ncbi:hypothetical protein [Pedobacter sp. SYSU D00535]|uniref:hypothetical protein n=1 Tax=Pedobacter sp. SYSU D00535 TaxID=2810308 RepID=UPI001A95E523|nr:hypothetical protein [Pedobacter sp. SYSU D00535]
MIKTEKRVATLFFYFRISAVFALNPSPLPKLPYSNIQPSAPLPKLTVAAALD